MGFATIIGGGADGRYTVELDFGEAQRVALIAAINQALDVVGDKIVQAQAKVALADAAEAAQVQRVDAAAAAIAAAGNNLAPGSPVPNTAILQFELAELRKLQQRLEPFYIALRTLKRSQANLIAKRTDYATLVVKEQRGAWCCDLTEDGTGEVATVDLPGESDLILIAPACRGWVPTDGYFRARELLSPEQTYFNAAVLPSWQKYKPTYRWGTVTFVDKDANLVNLTLGPASSSAQRINTNQTPQLNGVPVEYMSCDAAAFRVGDRAVVRFLGQDWENPLVIGFLDNPRACTEFPSFVVFPVLYSSVVTPGAGAQDWAGQFDNTSACGTAARKYSRPNAGSALHTLSIGTAYIPNAVNYPGAVIACSAGPQAVAAFASAAWGALAYPPSAAPTGYGPAAAHQLTIVGSVAGEDVIYDGSQMWVRDWSCATANFDGPAWWYDPPGLCEPRGDGSGKYYPSDEFSKVDVIPKQSMETWLTSVGLFPTISVTIDGQTKSYEFDGQVGGGGTDNLTHSWNLSFVLVE